MEKTYRLFISHSWTYPDAYEKVIKMLNGQYLQYYNHSVPKDDPIHTRGTQKELRAAIDAQMRGCSCVLILAGVYSSYSKWIQEEIQIAKAYRKPIIAIELLGSERTSRIVKDNADRIVVGRGDSIVKAIRELCN
jgi:hypothetical protein